MLNQMDNDKTPEDAAVERAIDALHEITGVHHTRKSTPGGGNPVQRSWHWITVLLTSILAVGTLVGVLGRAFFVQRDEYTKSEEANAVTHEAMRQTLDRVDRTMAAHTQIMTDMSKALQAQAVELAGIKRGR